jgi:uncharacterized cupin superfamily protein
MSATHRRRVVVSTVAGKSVVQSDEQLAAYRFASIPGYEHTFVWDTDGVPDLAQPQAGPVRPRSVVPGPGGSTLQIVTFPPASVMASPTFDREAARKESLERLPGLADTFEMQAGGMHRTQTVDYAVVLEGDIGLEVDDGIIIDLRCGDIVVQNGTRHAWRNRGTAAAVMLFFMNGARRTT